MSKGYFFIATGDRCRGELKNSLATLRSVTDLPIALASDQRPNVEIDVFLPIDNPTFSFQDKVLNIHRSPFESTIYADTDVSFFHSLDELFETLDSVSILVSHEASLGLGAASRVADVPASFPELSTGLIAYKNTKSTKKFLQSWQKTNRGLMENFGTEEDQPSFRKALFDSDFQFGVLPPEFHYIPANFMRVVGSKVYAVHSHDFKRAALIAKAFNTRTIGDYTAYCDGLGVFRNPWAMEFKEVTGFAYRCLKLLPMLVVRAALISLKQRFQWMRS